jgi:3-isopropylmalate dehydrogenase
MFEPIGGSAPKYTGQNVICPLAAIAAVQMLLVEIGEAEAADRIEQAIIKALSSGKIKSLNAGRMGMGTSEVGDLVAGLV